MPSSAAAALGADPLKKTRTTWLSADLRAVLSDTLVKLAANAKVLQVRPEDSLAPQSRAA